MSKLWKLPPNDKYWATLYPLQWRIFAENVALDEREDLELRRDLAEYAMAFHNYEGVEAVQRSRLDNYEDEDSHQPNSPSTDDAFFQQLQDMGIDLSESKLNAARAQAKVEEEELERSAPSSRKAVQQDIMRVHKKG